MNKYILIAATALTFAACTNEEMNTVPDGKVALQVNATIQGAQTRASGTEWAEGDEIGISIMGNSVTTYSNVCYEWNGSSFTTSPNNAIYFETSEMVTFHAYYPYKGSADYTGVSTAADNQTTANQPKIDFLYASGATASKDKPTVNFTEDHAFTHCMSQITLTFIEGDGMDLDGSWSYTLGGLKLQGTFSPQTGNATADDVTAASLTVNLTEVQPTSGHKRQLHRPLAHPLPAGGDKHPHHRHRGRTGLHRHAEREGRQAPVRQQLYLEDYRQQERHEYQQCRDKRLGRS